MNRPAHDLVGAAAGAAASYYFARNQSDGDRFLEIIGGSIGGIVGSRLPDVIDPPTSPNHRSLGHGVVPVGCTAYAVWELLERSQAALRAKADDLRNDRDGLDGELRKLGSQLLEWLCRILAGMVMGVVGGYASHLALDVTTAKGLPLVA